MTKTGPAVGVGDGQHLRELPREHGGRADVKRLARAHDLVQRFEGFLHRRMRIEAVDLIKIDVIGAETAQAVVDGVADVLARKAALIRIIAHGVEDFRRDDQLFAGRAEILQGATQHLFAGTPSE